MRKRKGNNNKNNGVLVNWISRKKKSPADFWGVSTNAVDGFRLQMV